MFSTNMMASKKASASLQFLGSTQLKDSHAGRSACHQINRSENTKTVKFRKTQEPRSIEP